MLKDVLVEYCAPTLAGLKTGNIISVRNDDSENIDEEIRDLNRVFAEKGLRLIPLRRTDRQVMVYLYRPKQLKKDLTNPEAHHILENKGYPCDDSECCVARLRKNLTNDSDFPHEIGLFLGYPPEDVRDFMDNPCKKAKCIGCWKVYNNEVEARKTFDKFDRCRRLYRSFAKSGRSIETLVVGT